MVDRVPPNSSPPLPPPSSSSSSSPDSSSSASPLPRSGATRKRARSPSPAGQRAPPPSQHSNSSASPPRSSSSSASARGAAAAGDDEDEEERLAEVEQAVEYRNWRVNSSVLYSTIMTHTLEWPALSMQWLPQQRALAEGGVSQRLLVGSHANTSEANALILMEVNLPDSAAPTEAKNIIYASYADYEGFAFGPEEKKFSVIQTFPHHGEINILRACPFQPNLVACKGPDGKVHIFDVSTEDSAEPKSTRPVLVLDGLKGDGFGLAWGGASASRRLVASCGNDSIVALWDVSGSVSSSSPPSSSSPSSLAPLWTCSPPSANGTSLNSVSWVSSEVTGSNLLLLTADNGTLCTIDVRSSQTASKAKTSFGCLNAGATNEIDSNVIAVGADLEGVHLFDLRRFDAPVHSMKTVADDGVEPRTTLVSWHPWRRGLLLSAASACGSCGPRASVWDVNQIGAEQSAEEAEDGPAELIFTHGGCTAAISDMGWNPCGEEYDLYVGNVTEDNSLQIWQMKLEVFMPELSDEDGDGGDDDEEGGEDNEPDDDLE
eukprot:GHVT01034312.1.p1 GENE.GHVT01034312.1~~GHVT01034312.1.p1  ORF type:complete len:546 (+),score=158.93 GHVT01034312.1:4989-6626(+)